MRENPRMLKMQLAVLLLVVCGSACAQDQFVAVKCGGDIPKAVIGKRESNQTSNALEEKYKELGLKDLGGSMVTDRLFMASWQICGNEYELLTDTRTGLVRDAIQFPAHSATSPEFVGTCQVGGKAKPGTVVAVLDNSAKYDARDEKLAKTMLKATAAWRVDKIQAKFVKEPTDNLTCPLDGIVTADGGP